MREISGIQLPSLVELLDSWWSNFAGLPWEKRRVAARAAFLLLADRITEGGEVLCFSASRARTFFYLPLEIANTSSYNRPIETIRVNDSMNKQKRSDFRFFSTLTIYGSRFNLVDGG